MKKILSLIAAASMTLSANSKISPFQDMNFKDWGKLQLVGNQLSDKNGNPVQLKGWSTFSLHYDDVQGCLGHGKWALMKQYGANIVRLAMYVDEDGSYLSNPDKFKIMVKEAIASTKELDMYCMIDWHVLETNGKSGNPNDYINESKDFFNEISKYCADNGYDHVLYELCNEPICGWSQIKSYAEALCEVITKNQPDAIIVVGTDQWCQKITEPIDNKINSKYEKNVMYSFHYYSCSHFNLLSDFRKAQKYLPVFVSEWSAVKFNGDGPFCQSNADAMIAACEYQESVAPQVVSWCIWNWGKKDEASSFFTGSCAPGNESQYIASGSDKKYGDYVKELMAGYLPDVTPCCAPVPTLNKIPTTSPNAAWRWDYYNTGGEGFAYHDRNSGAWKKNENGVILDYSNENDEVDVFSLAYRMAWLDTKCPWSTVVDGEVKKFDESIATEWKDLNGNNTYRSLNGGRMYSGTDGSSRPDEGVDLSGASCKGTDFEYLGYSNLELVEEDEWIIYTVDVKEPGYYKIGGVVNADYKGKKANGEISIMLPTDSVGLNLLRSAKEPSNPDLVKTFGFTRFDSCADPNVPIENPWDCWSVQDARSGSYDEIYCVFPKSGKQEIIITFVEDASGVGPLTFEFAKELVNGIDDCCYDPDGEIDNVYETSADASMFSVEPNPTSGDFTVILAENGTATVDVVNMAGQVVVSRTIEGSATINKTLTSGVYSVVVKSNGAVGTQKLIVK